MSNQKIIEELEQAESEALAAKAGEVIAGNVVKEAHYTGEVVGLRIALGLLRRSAEAAPNIKMTGADLPDVRTPDGRT